MNPDFDVIIVGDGSSEGGDLRRIVFVDGSSIESVTTGHRQHCELGLSFGCDLAAKGSSRTDRWERTSVPGLYAVGDCSRNVLAARVQSLPKQSIWSCRTKTARPS